MSWGEIISFIAIRLILCGWCLIVDMLMCLYDSSLIFHVTLQLRGGGYEPELHYPNWRRVHKPIDRHHVLLDSLTKLMDGKILIDSSLLCNISFRFSKYHMKENQNHISYLWMEPYEHLTEHMLNGGLKHHFIPELRCIH